MQDGEWLNVEDKARLAALLQEQSELKIEHNKFAANKAPLSADEKMKWKANSQRTTAVVLEIKDLRHKNILEAARG